MVGNENKKINNPINQTNLARKEFQALWSKINQKAAYQIEIDTEKLIKESVKAIAQAAQRNDFVEALSYTVRTGTQGEQLSKS